MMKLENGNYLRPHKRFHWWMGQSNYFKYMMREVSSLFIGAITLTIIWGVWRFSEGPASYQLWLNHLWHNLSWFSLLCFIFATYHSITWFWVTPKAMPITINNKPVAGSVIIGAHILAWLIVSVVIWLFASGGI